MSKTPKLKPAISNIALSAACIPNIPSLDEVKQYLFENDMLHALPVAEEYYNHFLSQGWARQVIVTRRIDDWRGLFSCLNDKCRDGLIWRKTT